VVTIFERLKRLVVERLGVEAEMVVPAASFTRDLGADSIEMVELVMSLEEEFSNSSRQVEIPDGDMDKMITVQNAVEYLRGLGVEDG